MGIQYICNSSDEPLYNNAMHNVDARAAQQGQGQGQRVEFGTLKGGRYLVRPTWIFEACGENGVPKLGERVDANSRLSGTRDHLQFLPLHLPVPNQAFVAQWSLENYIASLREAV